MVRDYAPSDKQALVKIHSGMGIDYPFPELENPLFLVKKVAERDGNIAGALVLRICAEGMLLLGEGHPRDKFEVIRELQDEALAEAYMKGLADVFADVPPINFAKRLRQLGWNPDRPGWTVWSRSTQL